MKTTASPLDRFRTSLNEIEESNLPGSIKSAARFARRAGRSVLLRTRTTKRLLSATTIKRNILYPIRNIVLRNKPLVVNAGGLSFLLGTEGAVPSAVWSSSRDVGRGELEFILSALQPGMTFFDIGANVGFFSLPAAGKVQHGKIYAFEPATWTFERLKENADLNKVRNVMVVHSAVGDYTGEATLQINVSGKDGLNTIGKPAHEDSEVVDTERVPIITLDEFVGQNSISQIDVMKIDVQGAELFVLRGAKRLLAGPSAPLILYEGGFLSRGFDYHPVESMWLLQRFGYSFFVIDSNSGKISIPPHSRAYDAMVIAVKPSHPSYTAIEERLR